MTPYGNATPLAVASSPNPEQREEGRGISSSARPPLPEHWTGGVEAGILGVNEPRAGMAGVAGAGYVDEGVVQAVPEAALQPKPGLPRTGGRTRQDRATAPAGLWWD